MFSLFLINRLFEKTSFLKFSVFNFISESFIRFLRLFFRVVFFLARRNLFLSKVLKDKFEGRVVRLYLKNGISLENFFEHVKSERYIVLRWFDTLPQVKKGEDIDILISPDSLTAFFKFMTFSPKLGGQKFDLYPSNYNLNMNFNNISYFSENLADEVLSNTILLNNRYRVPDEKYHKLTLLYHMLYHKAEKSGFTFSGSNSDVIPEHNYKKIVYDKFGIEINSLLDIYHYLESSSFNPGLDMIKKYASILKSPSLIQLNNYIEDKIVPLEHSRGELVMFVVRKALTENEDIYSKFKYLIALQGFEVLDQHDLDDNNDFSSKIRGNNWGKGPWPVSGGKPSVIWVCYNSNPKYIINDDGFQQDIAVKNVKNGVRDYTREERPYFKQFNGVHTSDSTAETLEYCKLLSEKYKEKIYSLFIINERHHQILSEYNIVKDLSIHGRRANVYKIKIKDNYFVLKFFKLSCKKYYENELTFYLKANESNLPVPRLINHSNCILITEFIEGVPICFGLKEIIFGHQRLNRTFFRFVDDCHKLNFFNSDFVLFNNIISKNGLVFYDFEFMQTYKDKVIVPYEILGVPEEQKGEYLFPLSYNSSIFRYKFYNKLHYRKYK